MIGDVNKKAAFCTLGCKVNIYETDAMRSLFEAAGYETVPFADKADVYVVNTCSVTNIADRKSRQMLHRARRTNPDAVVIAAGCYVQGAEEKLLESLGADVLLGNDMKGRVVEAAEQCLRTRRPSVFMKDLEKEREYEALRAGAAESRVRAVIKIEDGCDQFCSYCIIPYRRGRVRLRDPEDVLAEAADLAEAGHRELVLTGIHISSCGEKRLAELIARTAGLKGVDRIRLGSLEPRIITEGFLSALREVPQLCPHFHLSLQSGCDETLRAMNRHYSTREYEERVGLIRRFYEHPAVTTDIIAGFPGETREQFELSRDFADRIGFSRMHIFPYSRRDGTKAASMPGQLTNAEKQARAEELEEVDRRNSAQFARYYIGRETEVLTEEETVLDGERYVTGYTDTYVRAALPAAAASVNSLVRCRGLELRDGLLLCGPA